MLQATGLDCLTAIESSERRALLERWLALEQDPAMIAAEEHEVAEATKQTDSLSSSGGSSSSLSTTITEMESKSIVTDCNFETPAASSSPIQSVAESPSDSHYARKLIQAAKDMISIAKESGHQS